MGYPPCHSSNLCCCIPLLQVVFSTCEAASKLHTQSLRGKCLQPEDTSMHEISLLAKAMSGCWRLAGDMTAKIARTWTAQRLKVQVGGAGRIKMSYLAGNLRLVESLCPK